MQELRVASRTPAVALLVSIVISMLSAALTSSRAAAQTVAEKSPLNQVVAVTANLLEGFGDEDVQDMTEIRVFADRLLAQVPYAPDVLLLQEVRSRSARYVAQVMGDKTGLDYQVLVDAGRDPWTQRDGRVLKKDTAIVINVDTMQPQGTSGYVVTKRPANRKVGKPEYKYNAYGAAREIGTDMSVPMVSVHVGDFRLARRARKFANTLASSYPATTREDAAVIAGDFNATSPVRLPSGDLEGLPFWNSLTGDKHRFSDSIFSTVKRRGVDYIFATGGVAAGGVDLTYDASAVRSDPTSFYSDHRFRWALLGQWGPEELRAATGSTTSIDLSWSDAPTEKSYRIERAQGDGGWTQVRKLDANVVSYTDGRLTPGTRYRYRVVATNGTSQATIMPVASATTAPDVTAPTAPGWLASRSPAGTHKVWLEWGRAVDAEGRVTYVVWRSSDKTNYSLIGTTSVREFTDVDVTQGKTYSYYVTALDGSGNASAASRVRSEIAGSD